MTELDIAVIGAGMGGLAAAAALVSSLADAPLPATPNAALLPSPSVKSGVETKLGK